jgi:hypothetical protein
MFPLSFSELSAGFVELHLTWLGATRATRVPLIGKTGATVDGDTAREPHGNGEVTSGTGRDEGETWRLYTREELAGWEESRKNFPKTKNGILRDLSAV